MPIDHGVAICRRRCSVATPSSLRSPVRPTRGNRLCAFPCRGRFATRHGTSTFDSFSSILAYISNLLVLIFVVVVVLRCPGRGRCDMWCCKRLDASDWPVTTIVRGNTLPFCTSVLPHGIRASLDSAASLNRGRECFSPALFRLLHRCTLFLFVLSSQRTIPIPAGFLLMNAPRFHEAAASSSAQDTDVFRCTLLCR